VSGAAAPTLALAELTRGGAAAAPATVALIAANAVVFAFLLAHGAGLWHAPTEVQLAWGANFGPATQDGGWWRLASAMFMHFGLLHLALNGWALWDVGRLVERLLGPWRLAAAYLGSGLAGNLLSLVIQGNDAVSAGASGAIFGLYGVLLVVLARERSRFDARDFRWLFGAAALFAAVALGLGLFVRGIDNAAHGGGLVAGALLGLLLRRPLGERPLPRRERALAGAALAAAIALLLVELPAPRYRYGEELAAREAIRAFAAEERALGERWREILQEAEGQSFDALAGHIDEGIADEYADSFEQLSALHLDPGAPSAAALERLRRYAQRRSEASHALAEALRRGDEAAAQAALRALRDAAQATRVAPPGVENGASRSSSP
jgi:rhomboid protease GluP